MFFRRLAQVAAGELDVQLKPRNAQPFQVYLQADMGLNDNEFSTLVGVARACGTSVGQQDAAAKALIDSIHARTPGGVLAPGQLPPEPPQALLDMQKQRDALMDQCVANVAAQLPNAAEMIDAYITRTIGSTSSATPLPIPTAPNSRSFGRPR